MSEARWAERDTSPERIEAAVRELLRETHAANEALVPARVLNLVVIADREWRGEVANRLERVGRYHPSRTILCTVQEGRRTMDASVTVAGDAPAEGGRVGVLRETVEITVGQNHLGRIDTIIDPILVSELPSVLWSPHSFDEAVESLLGLIDVILIDTDDPVYFDGPAAALTRAYELLDSNTRVTDLAWLRTIPWRERLAGAFEDPRRRSSLDRLKRIYVRYEAGSVVSALLLVGWLASRLGWEPKSVERAYGGALRGTATRNGGPPVSIEFDPVIQSTRGISGVTVSGEAGFSLSLDRGPGGLTFREQRVSAKPQQWKVLGASRGESGILGDGVRQALLHDQTYAPALHAARSFSP